MPRAIALSRSARTLLRRRLAGEDVEVTDKTSPAYRELERAGLMEPFSAPASHFRPTREA